MKRFFFFSLFFAIVSGIVAQPLPDSVKARFNAAKTDSEKGRILTRYLDLKTNDEAILNILSELKDYFKAAHNVSAEDYVRLGICRQLSRTREYSAALADLFPLLTSFEQRKDAYGIMVANKYLSYTYYAAGDEEKTLYYDKKTVDLTLPLNDNYELANAYSNISSDYSEYGFSDSGYVFGEKAVAIARKINEPLIVCETLSAFGGALISQKKYDQAIPYLRESLQVAFTVSPLDACYNLNYFSEIYREKNQLDSAKIYATIAAALSRQKRFKQHLQLAYQNLYLAYEKTGPMDSTFKYFKLAVAIKDSLYNSDKVKEVQAITVREQNRLQAIKQEKLQFINKIRMYAMLAGLLVFLLVGIFLYWNNRQKQKANKVLTNTLSELKSTQAQLIQSEKMASLGELTAGIAHEIQNPLNFVNNFSEVNKEMIDELQTELKSGNTEEAINISNDIKENEEKINHHGKRADAIVKGMLQHSKQTKGIKEPTDINALCDEYLRLSYHGLRAKDKSFNADFTTGFDKAIDKINIVPQDIGRVLLNLFNNAFYAVNEKKKTAGEEYQPTVSVETKKINGMVEIKVADNGNGIPQNIVDKIFQPFFTTKPTGQGTGLGLSLAYDIITKEHNGTIKVESKDGEGSEFVIQLPMN